MGSLVTITQHVVVLVVSLHFRVAHWHSTERMWIADKRVAWKVVLYVAVDFAVLVLNFLLREFLSELLDLVNLLLHLGQILGNHKLSHDALRQVCLRVLHCVFLFFNKNLTWNWECFRQRFILKLVIILWLGQVDLNLFRIAFVRIDEVCRRKLVATFFINHSRFLLHFKVVWHVDVWVVKVVLRVLEHVIAYWQLGVQLFNVDWRLNFLLAWSKIIWVFHLNLLVMVQPNLVFLVKQLCISN